MIRRSTVVSVTTKGTEMDTRTETDSTSTLLERVNEYTDSGQRSAYFAGAAHFVGGAITREVARLLVEIDDLIEATDNDERVHAMIEISILPTLARIERHAKQIGEFPLDQLHTRITDGEIAAVVTAQTDTRNEAEIARHRAEDDPCQRGTIGCCIDHVGFDLGVRCETW